MRTLVYEARRLAGLRSTWLVLPVTVAAAAALTVMTARHHMGTAPLSPAQAAHRLSAVPPILPLPLAAFGAGLLGALSYGHELRYPALSACLVPLRRRLRLLGAKLLVIAALAAALLVVTVLVDALVLEFVLPGAGGPAAPGIDGFRSGRGPEPVAALWRPLVMTVVAACACVPAAGLLRGAVGGTLVLPLLALLPAVVTAPAAGLLHRGGAWPRMPGGAAALGPLALTGVAGVLLATWVAVQLPRRTM
ncbi:hypothetical protein [Peterkaempfera griseoplana]|uniref:hypothetical protein n=1 Tax=Peterkaempfera griseoplana TaxID=66896 RepID=UPI0006E21B67|nr:hypothetical protein [Peterkaempfera griseoplana]